MKLAMVLTFFIFACSKAPSSKPSNGFATPDDAGRCQLAAVEARSLDAWMECVHPMARTDARALIERDVAKSQFAWEQWAINWKKKLAAAKTTDYLIEPAAANQLSYGDQHAAFGMSEHGRIELMRKDGRWWVVDPY